jgi:ADP-heptose:LPS heptosyltransferase
MRVAHLADRASAPRGRLPRAADAFREARRLLVLDVTGIGDTVCLAPFLRSVLAAKPGARVEFLGGRFAPELLSGLPLARALATTGSLRGDAAAVRRGSYDLVLVPGWVLKNTLVLLASGTRRAVGYLHDPSFRARLHSDLEVQGRGVSLDRAEPLPRGTHLTRRGDPLLRALGLEPPAAGHALGFEGPPLPGEVAEAAGAGPYAVVHAGAAWSFRRWESHRFARVVEHLAGERGLGVFLIGGPEDRARNRWIREAVSEAARARIHDLTGRIGFGETGALLAGARLFLGNDSGPLHQADAVGCPVIALMGPNLPEISGPLGQSAVVLHHLMHCCPCEQRTCPEERPCMTRIEPAAVRGAAGRHRQTAPPAGRAGDPDRAGNPTPRATVPSPGGPPGATPGADPGRTDRS